MARAAKEVNDAKSKASAPSLLLNLESKSRAAGAKLFGQCWLPKGAPRAIILLAHGYAEHLGRYEHVAKTFTDAGLAVYALDHWGHGRSDGARGFVPHFSVFLDGMAALLDMVQHRHPKTPRILLGHSMGGLIAAHHLLHHQSAYCAAILSGPAVQPGTPPSAATQIIGRLLSAIAPHMGLIALEAEAVSRDPQVVADYLADPLVYHGKMSARLASEMLRAMMEIQEKAVAIQCPLLVVHGSLDRLAAPSGGAALVQAVSSSDKEFRALNGLYHEVFNEPEREEVLAGVLSWITSRIS